MKPERTKMDPGTKRFDAGRRHYHQSQSPDEEQWDEFLGEKIKSPRRRKLDQVMHAISTLVVGCLLLGGILYVLYFVLGKVLRIFGK